MKHCLVLVHSSDLKTGQNTKKVVAAVTQETMALIMIHLWLYTIFTDEIQKNKIHPHTIVMDGNLAIETKTFFFCTRL